MRFHKKHARTRYAELVFLYQVRSAGHVAHSGASRVKNFKALFVMLRWDRCRFYEKRTKTHYTELLFLHTVGYAGHVVHSGAFGA
jgi:hypothetical protein